MPEQESSEPKQQNLILEKVTPVNIEDEMKRSYIDYAMSVIVGRALPDVRDGLKPVHRRILYAMNEQGMTHDKPYKKSARIVGDVLGKYHPHGDIAVYDSLVRMVQEFSLRYPLIDGQGNFGCFTGDTRIKLLDGTEKSFEELASLNPDEIFYVYSVDENGHIVVGEGKNARITRRHSELLELTIDNGEKIRCTPDHRFMLRDGTYKEAQDLTTDDSLMPAYFDTAPIKEGLNDYLRVLQPDSGEYDFVYNHKIISKQLLKERVDTYDISVDRHHNFLLACGVFVHNSIDGDSAAAMRYTEVRLGKIADEILGDIDKETVDFVPNYDDSLKEPSVLPCKLPNLLINGSTGIAVGMATNMPPHNLGEVIDGITMVIDKPDVDTRELNSIIKGPDFPTAGFIYGRQGIIDAYTTGRGSVKMRARAIIEEVKNKETIIVNEIPYQVNKAKLIEDIAGLVRDKKIAGITDLRDESDKDGIRIVIEISRQSQANIILNQLYSHTQLETTFGVINLALVDGRPMVLPLKELIVQYISHRKQVIIRRSQFELKKAQARAHILEGLIIALDHIDEVIKLIRASKTPDEARDGLVAKFSLSVEQAKAILDMRLQRLTGLEREKIDTEYGELQKTINWLKELLASEIKILALIKEELADIKARFANKRRTEIIESTGDLVTEDLIPKEDDVITITNSGYIKRIAVDSYKQQRRGGKGVIGMETKEEDFVSDLFIGNTHDYLLFFTDKGKVYWLKVYGIPEAGRQARGTAIVNLLQLEKDEKINAYIPISRFDEKHYLLMVTKKGTAKKTQLTDFSNPRKTGIIAISLDEGDKLVSVKLTDGSKEAVIGTKHGKAIRFNETDVRDMGRSAYGVRGIRLVGEDEVVSMAVVEEGATLLTVTENGFGKRTVFDEYRTSNRGGQGVITIDVNVRNGNVVDIRTVQEDDEIMVTTSNGIIIRVPASGIRVQGRNTQGVKIMNVGEKDKVVGVATLAKEEEAAVQEKLEVAEEKEQKP
ncbi:MAG: DNA gyrase subunit A [Candidatus Methanoperedenaceae archaeon]|nr:MAG: DNA gyrase subunit A [Candidatus Methanoperedenaceae archaeon]